MDDLIIVGFDKLLTGTSVDDFALGFGDKAHQLDDDKRHKSNHADTTEGVREDGFFAMLSNSEANGERHNESAGHRTRSHAAGIESDGAIDFWNQEREANR